MYYIRRKGSYFLSAIKAWYDLVNDLANNNIVADRQTFYGISQDDPNAVNIEKDELRFDVCVKASAQMQLKGRTFDCYKRENFWREICRLFAQKCIRKVKRQLSLSLRKMDF